MPYHFDNLMESFVRGEEIYIPTDLLQPIQLGLCKESLNRVNRGLRTDPINIWPIDGGESYALLDGKHTTRSDYDSGIHEVLVSLGYDMNLEIRRFFDEHSYYADLNDLENWVGSDISEIQHRADFARANGIYHVRDSKIITETTNELKRMTDEEFLKWHNSHVR